MSCRHDISDRAKKTDFATITYENAPCVFFLADALPLTGTVTFEIA